jgi:hypothetical protein
MIEASSEAVHLGIWSTGDLALLLVSGVIVFWALDRFLAWWGGR